MKEIKIATTRGQTRYKDAYGKPEIVKVTYEMDGGLPCVTFDDVKQDYKFQIIITRKVAELLRKVVEDYDGNA